MFQLIVKMKVKINMLKTFVDKKIHIWYNYIIVIDEEGTKIESSGFESALVTGFTADRNVTIVTVHSLDRAYSVFTKLANMGVPVDVIGQSVGLGEFSFTVKDEKVEKIQKILGDEYDVTFTPNCGKVSLVGCGMLGKPEVAKDVYEALAESNVKIKLISSSEIKFSVRK